MRKQIYISSVFFVFAFLFVSPVLSPSINGNTIYLSWFVPFFDFYFIKKITNIKLKAGIITGFLIFTSVIFLHSNYMLMFKALSIIFPVAYLQYAYKEIGFKKLYKAFNINILIAILQFLLYFINRRTAYLFGPNNISRLIWGNLATQTNTNFYPVFYLPRTCGLSREAGFFAALLCIVIIIYINDKKIRKTKFQKRLFFIAYIVSFSKMSFALLIMLAIFRYRRRFNKIPLIITLALFVITAGILVNFINQRGLFYLGGESWTHRLWGYGVVYNHLNIKEFLIGNRNGTEELNKYALEAFPSHKFLFKRGFTKFCGLPDLIIYIGYIGLAGFLIFLKFLGVRSGYFLLLLIATSDVDLLTSTSFVVLSYWFAVFGLKNERSFSAHLKRKIKIGIDARTLSDEKFSETGLYVIREKTYSETLCC